tara:strand:+ start:13162 stop:14445 length:1284 start_codon:yes stop_codon:yes gene_type:complete
MATVTEHRTAIAMAREGGLGCIHQFGTIEEQMEEVKKVKRSTSYVIDHPLSTSPHVPVREAVELMKSSGVTSLLVVSDGELQGIFTNKDYLFEDNWDRPLSEVMTPKERLITADPGIELSEAKKILHKHRIEKLPLVQNGQVRGLITTKDIKKLEYWPNATRDSKGRLRVAGAIGVKDALERARALVEAGVDCLVLDIAHAHSDLTIETLKQLKQNFPVDVMVGNIATGEAARDLCEAGADGLKVGVGPSPVCTTRVIAGAGVPQFTAVSDVCAVAKEFGVPVTADGGLKYPGDVSKAIGAGASTIFSGWFFAGTDEAPGMIILKNGKRYKKYHGSASYESSHKRRELKDGRRVKERLDVFVEGVSSLVDYKGSVQDVINSIAKGLRSAVSYCGARDIPGMQANAEFIQITAAGWEESKSRGMKTEE